MTKILKSKYKLLKRCKVDLWNNYINKYNNIIFFDKEKKKFFIKNNYLISKESLKNNFLNNSIFIVKKPSLWSLLNLANNNKSKILNLLSLKKTGLNNYKNFVRRIKTNYGTLLDNQQKLRKFYGNLTLKQYKKIKKNNLSLNNFIYALESRLDILLYRLNLVPSIWAARQLITHKNIYINDKIINICSYKVKFKDVLHIKKNKEDYVKLILKKKLENGSFLPIPNYIETNYKTLEFIFLRKLTWKKVYYPAFSNKDKYENLTQLIIS